MFRRLCMGQLAPLWLFSAGSLVDGTHAASLGWEIICCDWLPELNCVSVWQNERGMDSNLAAAVGGKEGQNQATWQLANVLCVCLCVFVKAQLQLQKTVWLWFITRFWSLVSKSSAFVRRQTHWPRPLHKSVFLSGLKVAEIEGTNSSVVREENNLFIFQGFK